MFGLWQAITDGGKNLVPKAWGGHFPFQVKVALVTPEIISIPKAEIPAKRGRFATSFRRSIKRTSFWPPRDSVSSVWAG
jgi:hypothetical protein